MYIYVNTLNSNHPSIMKYLIRILFLLFLSKNLHGQEIYGEALSPYIDGRGSDLYNEANRTILNPDILSKSKLRIPEMHRLRRQTMLLAEANRRLHFDIKETRRMARRANSFHHREQLLADAWSNSPTGKRDGRPWSDLFEDEQQDYRDRYFKYFNRGNQSSNASLESSPDFISEQEFSDAWEKNAASRLDGRTWTEYPEGIEKDKIREKYRAYKAAMKKWQNLDGNPFYEPTFTNHRNSI